MPIRSSSNVSQIELLEVHLKTNRYAAAVQRRYLWLTRRFVDYLERKSLDIEAVHMPEAALDEFLRWELRSWRRRHRREPRNLVEWRRRYKDAINMFLRLVHGNRPVATVPATALEVFHGDVLQGYDVWMRELRGLASITRSTRTKQAQEFLTALGPRGDQEGLATPGHVCATSMRTFSNVVGVCVAQPSRATRCVFRSFLRYLRGTGRTALDLSSAVMGPRIYDNLNTSLRHCVLRTWRQSWKLTRQDCSPTGRRDYAFLMLLAATYGLRAGEIVALRLENINWGKEIICVRHSKTGADSELPLLRQPGEAVLSYLESARPQSRASGGVSCNSGPHMGLIKVDRSSILSSARDSRLLESFLSAGKALMPFATHERSVCCAPPCPSRSLVISSGINPQNPPQCI